VKIAGERATKTVYGAEYVAVLRLLREFRRKAGITQVDLAGKLGQTRSFVNKVERGDRRLYIVQLRTLCRL
jgi:transcriptional regulator with XRE-family HTH domain